MRPTRPRVDVLNRFICSTAVAVGDISIENRPRGRLAIAGTGDYDRTELFRAPTARHRGGQAGSMFLVAARRCGPFGCGVLQPRITHVGAIASRMRPGSPRQRPRSRAAETSGAQVSPDFRSSDRGAS